MKFGKISLTDCSNEESDQAKARAKSQGRNRGEKRMMSFAILSLLQTPEFISH